MIFLHKPYIRNKNGKSRLYFDLDIDKEKKKIWYEVNEEYKQYLCDDRIDAILVGILLYAMEHNQDIESDSYITDDILFKIEEYLIPSLSKYGEKLNRIKINIKTKPSIKNIGAVGTGCSCGIDSLHAYITKSKLKDKKYNITHLCINNVGSFNSTYEEAGIKNVQKKVFERAKKFAQEVNLPLIITDSNFQEEIPQVHYFTHTYSSTFAILCLQKLWGIYYYGSSGLDLSSFSIKENDKHDCANYELLSLSCFSTKNLTIYSDGAAESRLEKTKDIYKDKLVKKYLHTCLKQAYNCSKCDKCKRTLLSLYALTEDLSDYKEIFDIDYFYEHLEEYFEWLYIEHQFDSEMAEPIYNQLFSFNKQFKEYVNKKSEELKKNINLQDYYMVECQKILNSSTYKVGKVILWLPAKIKKIIKRTLNK